MVDVSEMYTEKEALLNRIDPTSYAANMELFRQKYAPVLTYLLDLAENGGPAAAAELFVDSVAARFSSRRKIPSFLQPDLNSFTVYYVLPALDLSAHPMRLELIKEICVLWASRFRRGSIRFASYDTILNSFSNTFLGIRL